MALQEEFELQGNWLFRYRSFLPLAILAVGVAVFVFTVVGHGGLYVCLQPFHTAYEWSCLCVSLLGVWVRAYTVGHTPGGTSGRNTARQVADCLNTTGIYSVVRHPLYLGNFLMWLGISLLTCSPGFVVAFILVYFIYYERIMYAEEQFLRRKFGQSYEAWASVTPAFVPRPGLFVPSPLPFSWKKVLKKEKNGVFALLLTFAAFDAIGALLGGGYGVNMAMSALALVSGIAYVVLTYIKHHTRLLDESGR